MVLARAGCGERFIADLIRSKPARFDTSVGGLAFLAQQGIPESLVRRIIESEQRLEQEESSQPEKAVVNGAPAGPVAMRTIQAQILVPQSQQGSQKDVWYVLGQRGPVYRIK